MPSSFHKRMWDPDSWCRHEREHIRQNIFFPVLIIILLLAMLFFLKTIRWIIGTRGLAQEITSVKQQLDRIEKMLR